MGGMRVTGRENIPGEGAVIFAPNHFSNLDPPLCAAAQRKRQLWFMAKEELFAKKWFGALIASLGAYPVRRGETDSESIRKTIALLESDKAVLVFPEGSRGDGVSLGAVNRGVSLLAKRTGAWVLPIGIVGTQALLPSGSKKMVRGVVRVRFGKPFRYEDVAGANERAIRENFARELASRIVELCAAEGLALKTSTESEAQSAEPRR